jgi:hypothetical protein
MSLVLLLLLYRYRARLDFREDAIYRHIDPGLAFMLELFRLSRYNISLVWEGR